MRLILLLSTALQFALCTAFAAEEIHEEFRRLAASPDSAAQRVFLQTLKGERQQLTAEINTVLTNEHASIFAKVFALKAAEATSAHGALEAALPFVGTIDTALAGAQEGKTSLIGARALTAMGAPADDRLIEMLNGKESAETNFGIAYVIVALNGRQRGIEKIEKILKDPLAADGKKLAAQKILESMNQITLEGEVKRQ